MFQEIKINGITLPRPNDDLVFKDNKMTTVVVNLFCNIFG